MILQKLPRLVWIVPAAMLCIALARLPYGYYTLLRIVTCGAALLLAWSSYEQAGRVTFWVAVLGAIAVIFNPVFPLHLNRPIWAIINIATAVALIGHMVTARRGTGETDSFPQ